MYCTLHTVTRVWYTLENVTKSEHPTFGRVMRSNYNYFKFVQYLYSITNCNTYMPADFVPILLRHARRTFRYAIKSTLQLKLYLDYPNQILYNKEANNNRISFANTIIHLKKEKTIDIQCCLPPLAHRTSCNPDSRSAFR
jgi:hypothetical protein